MIGSNKSLHKQKYYLSCDPHHSFKPMIWYKKSNNISLTV